VEEEERARRVVDHQEREKAREKKRAELYNKYKQRQAAEAEAAVQKEMKAYDLAQAELHIDEAAEAYTHVKQNGASHAPAAHSAPAAVAPQTSASVHVVRFSLPYGTNFGQLIAVAGSVPELGSWDSSKALKLTWNSGNVWEGDLRLAGTSTQPIEYKFVVVDSEGHAQRWEGGANRVLKTEQLATAGGHPLVVATTWVA
jgi:hypothetical protein